VTAITRAKAALIFPTAILVRCGDIKVSDCMKFNLSGVMESGVWILVSICFFSQSRTSV
jgi:hypothetical protein